MGQGAKMSSLFVISSTKTSYSLIKPYFILNTFIQIMDQSLLAEFLMFVSKTSLMPSVGSNPFVKHEFYEDQGLISRSPKECKMACLALNLKY